MSGASLWGSPFHRFAGEIVAAPDNLDASSVRLGIEAASIDTQNQKRDRHLRSEDFSIRDRVDVSFSIVGVRP